MNAVASALAKTISFDKGSHACKIKFCYLKCFHLELLRCAMRIGIRRVEDVNLSVIIPGLPLATHVWLIEVIKSAQINFCSGENSH